MDASTERINEAEREAQCYDGMGRDEAFALRNAHNGPLLTFYPHDPLLITRGCGQYLFDDKGKKYLDLFAGIVTVSVGHCHPKITDAIVQQAQTLVHTTTIYGNTAHAKYAASLAAKLPKRSDGKKWKLYFVNSGSEANDLAMHLARAYTGRQAVFALRNCYHGMSTNLQSVTAVPGWQRNNGVQVSNVHHVPMPYVSLSLSFFL